ncbi:isoaspartyl peptidase/L-asparaginase [Martelella alba]|uniref:Isoaspartyl peptidase n=1 Tax=Martelella alba TaxID=2590451 RepID=A0A506UIY2_9HYPH|nr:isoaspartyl peptidase/L-asparaginase [Martelella alba]TPW33277.1 isoaspartyl peptidase/L-asparaginase [Martelella alba]
MSIDWAIALHGGAGTILKDRMTPEKEAAYRQGLEVALAAGRTVLEAGGPAEDAVQASVVALEDNPLFNAGRGAVLTADGSFELDAAIMRGHDMAVGAVFSVADVASPITLARLILEQSPHVAFCGEGASRFARANGLPCVSQDYFETEYRRQQLEKARAMKVISLDHNDNKFGTVGAVARDCNGNLAAATSTGGMTNKAPGRIGDSPVIGAGTYASNASCAVSATGHGELFIRLTVARDIAAMMEYGGVTLMEAAQRKVLVELEKLEAESGGVIAVGKTGSPVLVFNSAGMYRASQCAGAQPVIGIYGDSD